MIVIGLTGSIGMGKSTAGAMLERLGVPVHDADASVHNLLQKNSPAWKEFKAAFPRLSYPSVYFPTVTLKSLPSFDRRQIGAINRAALGRIIFDNDELRLKLESILHPHVQRDQQDFIRKNAALGKAIVALDIPLLFETGADSRVDYTINISAPAHIQRARVLARPNMSEEKFEKILQRQMPDGEKSARADFVVHSGLGRATMMKELKLVLKKISADS